ncbi:hypothetical protein CXG81DRAFT_27576 [Caulochytrium protostelioides]|uniref:Radial spoke 3 n=1 Tax=Caulochytrium protostelioides TaxID=1555241 RepID=A0A4P9X3S4_9FUNG|nr:hypothetical protein CXG81DRAFT_27576 [Caulochytrium protostelioides]|eukprot:RKO99671.1 hypothetical protein CXG81DRAFT_27576 [Caulochytrium protostelioides]
MLSSMAPLPPLSPAPRSVAEKAGHAGLPGLPLKAGGGVALPAHLRPAAASGHAAAAAAADKLPAVNMMFDRRIHRGNTYAPAVGAAGAAASGSGVAAMDPVYVQQRAEARRRQRAQKRLMQQQRIRTPSPPPGHVHFEVQTAEYLEVLDLEIPVAEAVTQTDAFLDRAPSPLYIPQKRGIDVATQIVAGDLFDFDTEVQPLLEVLVGKTLEQALLEVHEEAELAALKRHQQAYEALRDAERAEVLRLEAAERRRVEEKQRRIAEQARVHQAKQAVAERVASRAFAAQWLQGLVPTVLESLTNNGYFQSTVEREVQQQFLPWLTEQVELQLDQQLMARDLVDAFVMDALQGLARRR